jgi:hypothetical protein
MPAGAVSVTRKVDRAVSRQLERAWPPIARAGRIARAIGQRAGKRLRPLGVFLFRSLAIVERRLLSVAALATRAVTRASSVLTPERAVCAVILASAASLVVAQFVDYRAVELGQPGYAGLTAATPPTVGVKTAGQAHFYLLIPLALLAAMLAVAVLRKGRRQLGRVVFVLGLISVALILLVDLPAGLDAGFQATRFSGAVAVLDSGFYAELASAAGLMLGGLLLVAAPKAAARYDARRCRTRISLLGRVASGLRRRRRHRASSRGRAARSESPHRSGAASAPASRP